MIQRVSCWRFTSDANWRSPLTPQYLKPAFPGVRSALKLIDRFILFSATQIKLAFSGTFLGSSRDLGSLSRCLKWWWRRVHSAKNNWLPGFNLSESTFDEILCFIRTPKNWQRINGPRFSKCIPRNMLLLMESLSSFASMPFKGLTGIRVWDEWTERVAAYKSMIGY